MKNNPFLETQKQKIDESVTIKAKRITIRMSEITWENLAKDLWFKDETTKVFLEKSDSPKSHFKPICTISKNSFNSYIDNCDSFSLYRTNLFYYRLVRDDKSLASKVFSCEKEHNLFGSEMVYRHSIQLKEGHSGSPMYLFIKNRTSQRCPECWDDIRSVRTKSNCKVCLNTGYITSYCDPICIYMSVSPEQITVQQEQLGTSVEGKIQAWTVAYPRINLGDVIVDPATQDIWCVSNVNITTHKRTPTKQELTLDRHSEDTAINKLLSLIPDNMNKEDIRHGEFLY